MGIKVIGAGFGRTGTLSLKAALEHLGLGPCYHMHEVRDNPGKADAWYDAAQGEPADWDDILHGYRACVDWPACHFWRPLANHYPDAKVILTVRDEEAWWTSIANTIFRSLQSPDQPSDPERRRQRRMSRNLIVEHVFAGKLNDRNNVLAVYRENIAAVKKALPAERLLVFDVSQGWAPLCGFLGLPVPAIPFPRTNSTEEFRQRLAGRKIDEEIVQC